VPLALLNINENPKNENLPCQQAQSSDLIGFQISFQFDLKKLFQHP
jgi:hypothetical protein